jgi:nitrous oxide reductase accessory protein NosL
MNQHITEGRKVILGILSFCALFIAAGCTKDIPKPSKISPNDTCFYCKSLIFISGENSQEVYAGQFITKDGFTRKFDDIGCLIADAKKVGKKNIKAFYAVDIVSQKWMLADQLHFVKADKIQTPMRCGHGVIIAFQDLSKARGTAAKYEGQVVSFGDLLP